MTTPWKEIRRMKMSDTEHEPIRKQVEQEVAELIWTQFCNLWSENKLIRDFNILQLETMRSIDLSPRMGFSAVTCYLYYSDDCHSRNRVFVAVTTPGEKAFKLYGVGSMPSVEEQAEFRTCDYCKAVGACPKCWGRAAIEEMKYNRHEFIADLVTILNGGGLDKTTNDLVNGLIARYERR